MAESGISRIQLVINTLANTGNLSKFNKKLDVLRNKSRLKSPSNFLDAFNKVEGIKSMDKQLSNLGLSFNKNGEITDTVNKKVVSWGDALKLASKRQDELRKKTNNTTSSKEKFNNTNKKSISNTNNFSNKITKLNTQLKKTKGSFLNFRTAMGSLSIMFMGQNIMRNMTRLMTTTVGTFREITKSQTEAGQAITALGANFKFLQFTIGNAISTALMPLLPTLIDVIQNISSWVQLHPKLTSNIILFGIALGTLMAVGGSFHLFLSGLHTITGFFATKMALKNIDLKALAKSNKSIDDFLAESGGVGRLKAGLALGGVVLGSAITIVSLTNLLGTEFNAENIGTIIKNSIGLLVGASVLGGSIAILAGASFGAGALIGFAIGAGVLFTIVSTKLDFFEKIKGTFNDAVAFISNEKKRFDDTLNVIKTTNELIDMKKGKIPLSAEYINNVQDEKAINFLTQNMQSVSNNYDIMTSNLGNADKMVPFINIIKDVNEKTVGYNTGIFKSFQSIDTSMNLITDSTPKYIEQEKLKQESLDNTATKANKAAAAQERLNRAYEGAKNNETNNTNVDEYLNSTSQPTGG